MIMAKQGKKAMQDGKSVTGVGTNQPIRVTAGKKLTSAGPKPVKRITQAQRRAFTKQQSSGPSHMVNGVDLSRLPKEVIEAVRGYHPDVEVEDWAKWAPIVIGFLPIIGPPTPGSATNTLLAILRLVMWCEDQGLPTGSTAEIFTADNIESFAAMNRDQLPKIRSKGGTKSGSGTTILDLHVSRLRSAGRIINPSSNWPILREEGVSRDLLSIYTDKEIVALHASAKRISDFRKRRIALASLAMGLGAGLSAGEQQRVRPEHVYQDSKGQTWVRVVRGSLSQTERLVPVASPWGTCLQKAINLKSKKFDTWVLPIGRSVNAVSENLNNLPFDRSCPPLSMVRMRTTWMVQRMAAGVWLSTLAQYAGLESIVTLVKATKMLPAQNHESALRGMTQRSMSAR
jgi:hypothetical protein